MKKILLMAACIITMLNSYSQSISASPSSFSISLSCSDSTNQNLTLTNNNAWPVDFQLFYRYMFACNQSNGTISLIDLVTNTISGTSISLNNTFRPEFSPGDSLLWVTARWDDVIYIVRTSDLTVKDTISGLCGPHEIAFNKTGNFAYVTNQYCSNVVKIDCNSDTIAGYITSAFISEPTGIVVTPDGKYAYVANLSGGVVVIDLATDNVIANIMGVNKGHSLIVSPDGRRVYISESINSGNVVVIDVATNAIIARIGGDFSQATGMDFTPDGKYIYAMDKFGDRVRVIDAATSTIIANINDVRFNNGWDISVSPDGNYVFASVAYDINSVIIINRSTNTVIGVLSTGSNGAWGLASTKSLPPWLGASAATGTVPASGSTNTSLEFNSTGLSEGTYNFELPVFPFEALNPRINIPCTLSVAGNPSLVSADTCLHFDTIYTGTNKVMPLTLYNTGCDTLFVNNVTLTGPFSANPVTLFVLPFDSAVIDVTFTPPGTGGFTGNLSLFTNDVNPVICLTGSTILPPVISFSPASLSASASGCAGDTVIQAITVYNTGNDILNCTVTGDSAIVDSTIQIIYTTSDATTIHSFPVFNQLDSVYVTVTINGDYDSGSENAAVYIEGDYIEQIPDNDLYNTNIVRTYAFGGAQVATWVNDGQFIVTVDNSPNVDAYSDAGNYHTVQIYFRGVTWPGWLTGSPENISVAVNDSAQIYISFISTGLVTGNYYSNVQVHSNDPVNPVVFVPCTLAFTGNPVMQLSDTCFIFDTIMQFVSSSDTLIFYNTGCDTLFVTDIISSSPDFSVDTTDFYVLPGDSTYIFVYFNPQTVNSYTGNFQILNNYHDTTVCFSGVSSPPPSISFNPSSFNVTISQCNDSLTVPLTIYNTGTADLTYSIENAGSVGSPVPAACLPQTTGYCCNIGIWAVVFGSINKSTGVGDGYRDYTATDFTRVISGQTYPITVTTGTGYNESARAWIDYNNNGSFEPNEMILDSYNKYVTHTANVTIPANAIYNTPLRMRVASDYYGQPVPQPCINVYYGQFEDYKIVINNFINLSSVSGTITPGDSASISVEFNALGLNAGIYSSTFIINSNDPLHLSDSIPYTFTVAGTGRIQLSDNCLYLDSIMEYTNKTDSFIVTNTGCDTLKIFSISSQTSNFQVSPVAINILPQNQATVHVTFIPYSTGTFYDTLTIASNNGDSLVCLSGKAFSRPVFSSVPTALDVTLGCSGTITDTLVIHNTGMNNLVYYLSTPGNKCAVFDGSGDHISRGAVNLPTGSAMSVSAWIYPVGYGDGTYNGIVSWGGRYCNATALLLSIQSNGRPSMATWCNDFVPGTGATAVLNQWNHIAVVMNGTAVTLYMNGTSVSGTLSSAIIPNVLSQNLSIGSTDSPGRNFNGKIDEVQIYNRALSQAEILAIMNNQLTGSETGLMGYYNFDDGTANDLSPAGNHCVFNYNATTGSPGAPVNASWIDYSYATDTVLQNDSALVVVSFASDNLTVSQYVTGIQINSNDPVNSTVNVPCTLHVVGQPDVSVSANCLEYDSVFQFAHLADTILFNNTGCDTLVISGFSHNTGPFGFDTTGMQIPPDGSAMLIVSFDPMLTGHFYDTLLVLNNDSDMNICLHGYALLPPVLTYNPASFNMTANTCNEMISAQLTISNSGDQDLTWSLDSGYLDLTDNFDTGINNSLWQLIEGGQQGSQCGVFSPGYALYFNGNTNRQAVTKNMNTISSTDFSFYLKIATGSGTCEQADGGEEIYLDYSVNNGSSWTNMQVFNVMAYPNFSYVNITLPVAAKTTATQFRWRQPNHSGSCCDHWSVDNVFFDQQDMVISFSQNSGVLIPGDSATVSVNVSTNGLLTGNFTQNMYIASNDPLRVYDTIPVYLTVNGYPVIGASSPCLEFDSIMQFGQATDSVRFYNSGCDTLKITGIGNSLSSFVVNPLVFTIMPGDSATSVVTFNPLVYGHYYDTLTVANNDSIMKICLHGYAYRPPVQAHNPDTIHAEISVCNGTDTLPVTIYNQGDTSLQYSIALNQTLDFNGSNAYVMVDEAVDFDLQNFTYTAWVKADATNGYRTIIDIDDDEQLLCLYNGQYGIFGRCGTFFYGTVTPGWHHVAWSVSGSSYSLYADGALIGIGSSCSASVNADRLMIGAGFGPNELFDGQIKEVSVWNIPLTSGQINQIMTQPPAGNESGLLAYWPFVQGAGNTTLDISQGNHTGTVVNATWGIGQNWINLPSSSGLISPGDSSIIDVVFNASDLITGSYTAEIVIQSNDPLTPVSYIPVVLTVNGYPVISTSPACLEFDSIFQFAAQTDTLLIYNTGCDTLTVSGISHNVGPFNFDTAGFQIMPADTVFLIVSFNPALTGHFYDTLHVFNNDSNINICLHGYAISPPVVSYSPDSVQVSLTGCNDSVSVPFTIYNTGDTTLSWDIVYPMNAGTALSFNGSGNYVLMANSNQFDLTYLTMEAWVFSNNFSQNGFIFEKGPVNSQYSMFFEGSSFCFRTVNIYGSMHSFYLNSASIGLTNGSWHHVACTYDGANKKVYVDGVLKSTMAYSEQVRTGMSGEIIGAYGATGSHSYYFNGNIDEVRVWNYAKPASEIFQNYTRSLLGNEAGLVACWTFNEGSGGTANDISTGGHNGTITGAAWITSGATVQDNILVDAYSGNIAASDSAVLTATFYRNNLQSGTYNRQIIIHSNDPLSPLDTISCTLIFNQHPVIDVSANCLEFDSLFRYMSVKDSVWVYNRGCDSLQVTGITHSQNEFTLNASSLSIGPGDSAKLVVTFLPVTLGHFYDSLNIANNDSGIRICLHGYAISPPVISVNPGSLDVTFSVCKDSIAYPVTISNTGDTTLNFNITTLGPENTALQFDGSNDYADMGSWFNYQNFTIEMWVKPGSTQVQYADIIDNNHTGFRSWVLQQNSTVTNQYGWGTNDGGGTVFFNLTADQWTHIAITRDGSSRSNKVYINGVFFSGNTGTANIPYDGTQFFRLGRWGGGGRNWNGEMDEIRVWNTVRTVQEIQQNMNRQLAGNESGLSGYWTLNEGAGTTLTDFSAGGNNGTISGGAIFNAQSSPVENGLVITPVSGNIYAGDSSIVYITIHANSINPGTYNRQVLVHSNDPLNPVDTVQVTFTITPRPSTPLAADTAICFNSNVPDLYAAGTDIRWYNDSSLVYSGNTFATGDSAEGVYTYYVTQTIDSCSSFADTVTLTINAIPAAPAGSDNTVCFENPDATLLATGSNILWFSDSALTNQVAVGNTFLTGLTVVGTYTFYLTQTVSNCTSPRDTSTLTINPIPTAPVVYDTTICAGNPTPVLITSGENIMWYADSTLQNLIHTGDTLSPGVTNAGIYVYYAAQTNVAYNCQGHASAATLTIDSLNLPPVVADNAICYGQPAVAFTATGDSIRWFSDAALTTQVASGNSFTPADTAVGNYAYYITRNNQCGVSSSDTAILVIHPIPAAPVAADQSVCYGYAVPVITATGTNILWYGDSTLLALLYAGDSLTTGETNTGTYHYFVTQTLNNCESPSFEVSLEIRPTPQAPVASDTAICFGTATPDFSAAGDNVQWYSDASLSTLVHTGNVYSSGNTATGIYSYYVTDRDTVAGCESFSDTVTLVIYAIPAAPAVADETICFGQPSPVLTVTGTNILWYSDTLLINSGNTYTPLYGAAGAFYYTVTQTVNNCVSPADTFIFTVNPLPSVPVAGDSVICSGNPTPDFIAQGTNCRWYGDSLLSNLVYSGDTMTPGISLAGSYNWYVTQTITATGCEGPFETVTLTIDSLSPAPVSDDYTICFGSATPVFTASGANVKWYADTALSVLLYSGNSYTSPDTAAGVYFYYVTQNNNCGESSPDTATLIINTNPSAPVGTGTSVCMGETVPALTASGDTVIWYQDAALAIPLDTTDSFNSGVTSAGTYFYYITLSQNNCQGPSDTVMLEIRNIPSSPVAADTAICFGAASPGLAAQGINISWYITAALDSAIAFGNIYTPVITSSGVYNYFITQYDSSVQCESFAEIVTLTVNAIPSAPTTADTAICFGQITPAFTAPGTNISWYSGASIIQTGNSFTPDDSVAGSYIYSVTQTVSNCESPADTIIFTINITPDAPVVSDTAGCTGPAIPDLTAQGVNLSWYNDSLLSDLVYSGDTFSSGVSLSGIYSWYVTQMISPTGCESPYAVITLNVDSLPVIPVAGDYTICYGSASPVLTATGSNVKWYGDAALSVLLYSGNNYTSPDTAVGNYAYFVTQSNNCGESSADSSSLTINPLPAPPDGTGNAVCFGQPTPAMNAAGSNIIWYQDSALLIALDTAGSYNPNLLAQGTYTFYLTQTVNGCESPADTAIMVIHALPIPPVAGDQFTCNSTVPALTASGINIQWYDNSGFIFAGDTLNTGQTQSGVYTYFASQTDTLTGCESNRDTATLTISTVISIPPVVNSASACYGQPVPDLTAQGVGIQWYADSTMSVLVDTGSVLVTGNTIPGTYSYWAIQQNICGMSPKAEATLTIHALPAAPVANDTSTCKGNLIGLLSTGNNLHWYQDNSLTTLLFIGNNYIPSPSTVQNTPGIYTYFITDSSSVTGCFSYTDSLVFTVKDVPVPPVANDTGVCFGGTVPDLIATGININWYSDPQLTTLVGTGTVFSSNQTAAGVYTYYLIQTNECGASAIDTASLTIGVQPVAPVPTGYLACFSSPNPTLFVGSNPGTIVSWYSDTLLTQPDTTGNSFTPLQTSVGTYVWYVTNTETLTGCTSNYAPMTLVINSLPLAPVVTDFSACEGSSNPAMNATGNNITWYGDSGLTTVVNNGPVYTPTVISAGIYYYYVTQTVNNCEGPSSQAVFTINTLPPAPVATDSTMCEGDQAPVLSSGGSDITWYSDPALTTTVATGTSYQPVTGSPGVHNWYVTQFLNGCESPYDIATLIINSLPSAPTAIDDTICYGGIVPVLTATGTNVVWFSDLSLTDTIQTGNTYIPADTSVGTHVYYLTQTSGNCHSLAGDVAFIVFDASVPPVASDVSFCEGNDSIAITATGVNINWYSDSTLNDLVYSGNMFVPDDSLPGTYAYYATQSVSVCGTSPGTEVTLTINALPVAPVSQDTSACAGTPVTLGVTGTNIKWYSDNSLGTLVFTGNNFIPPAIIPSTYIYYLTSNDLITGCASRYDSVIFIVKDVPAPPAGTDATVCFGEVIPDLTATGNDITWYSDAQLTVQVGSGTSYTTGQTNAGTYTYYITQRNECGESPDDSAILTINVLPVPPLASDDTICFGGTIPLLTAGGTNVVWYSDPALTDTIQTGNSYLPVDTSAGIHIYYITQTMGNCESPAGNVAFVVFDVTVPPVAADTSYCSGNPHIQLSASGVNIRWYSDSALTIPVYSGDIFAPGIVSAGTYTYYITQNNSDCGESPAEAVVLTIDPLPAPPAAENASACRGTSIPDLIGTGTDIRWYSEPETLNLVNIGTVFTTGNTNAGTYTYYVTQTVNGCTSVPNDVILTINPAPYVTLNKYHAYINQGSSVTLIAYNAVNYSWTPSTGLNTTTGSIVVASPAATTTYIVTGTNSQGCSDTAKCVVEVGQIGVDENNFSQYLSVYPNPTSGDLNIKYVSGQKDPLFVKIINQTGQSLVEKQIDQHNGLYEQVISMKGFADGVYYMQLMTEKGVITKKIVLRR